MVDQKKVDAILTWPTPTTVTELRNFLGLATFYRRFVREFSAITAPLSDCLKKDWFNLGSNQLESFELLKQKLASTPVLTLPNFDKTFEVETNACMTSIGAVFNSGRQTCRVFQ